MAAETGSHVSVQIVRGRAVNAEGLLFLVPAGSRHQDRHRPFAEQPDTGIDQEQMGGGQLADFVPRRFLQDEREPVGILAGTEKHAMVLGLLRLDPLAEREHVDLRHCRQRVGTTQQHIPRGDHHHRPGRCLVKQPAIQR